MILLTRGVLYQDEPAITIIFKGEGIVALLENFAEREWVKDVMYYALLANNPVRTNNIKGNISGLRDLGFLMAEHKESLP